MYVKPHITIYTFCTTAQSYTNSVMNHCDRRITLLSDTDTVQLDTYTDIAR